MTRAAEVLSTCVSSASQRVGLRLRFEDNGDERNVMKEVTGIVGVCFTVSWVVCIIRTHMQRRQDPSFRVYGFVFFFHFFFFHRKADLWDAKSVTLFRCICQGAYLRKRKKIRFSGSQCCAQLPRAQNALKEIGLAPPEIIFVAAAPS